MMILEALMAAAGQVGGGAPFVGPLDSYTTNLWLAHSTRRLLSGYSGALIRVRRSNDNAEQDIGFDAAGELDTAALLAFTGANSGYVAKLYDQSGGTRDATIGTSGAQPRIVNAGTVDLIATGIPGCKYDGSDDGWIHTDQPSYATVVATIKTSDGVGAMLHAGAPYYSYAGLWNNGDGSGTSDSTISAQAVNGSAVTNTRDALHDVLVAGVAVLYYVEVNTSGWTEIGFGAYSGAYNVDGTVRDYVVYSADMSSDQAGIEAALNDGGWIY